ncbi:MAG: hypothetical protein IKK39_10390 [Thermoguttaceae bacterium]|nr:hypothetical protein [Thermoguttaceae bacterium]
MKAFLCNVLRWLNDAETLFNVILPRRNENYMTTRRRFRRAVNVCDV